MKIRIRPTKKKLWLAKYLWVVILLAKEVQFFLLMFYVLFLINRRPIKRDKASFYILLGTVIQIAAIVNQVVFYSTLVTMERLLGALNTALIWFIAVFLYRYYLSYVTEEDYREICRYMAINLFILFLLYLFSLVAQRNSYYILGIEYKIRRMDYLETGVTTRFCGFMETVMGPSHLFCGAFPFALQYLKQKKSIWVKSLIAVMFYIPVYASHSRVGVLVCGAMLILGIVFLIAEEKHVSQVDLYLLMIAGIAAMGLFVFLRFDEISLLLIRLFRGRVGSNTARFAIYRASISMFFHESPIIGIGIKYLLGQFPLGSHSTYIGFLYKAGLAGTACFLAGLTHIIKRLYREYSTGKNSLFLFYITLLYFILLLLADIDGSDWNLAMHFMLWGVLSGKRSKEKGSMGYHIGSLSYREEDRQ